MLRKSALLTVTWMIGGSAFMGSGFCDENANTVEKAIRKYQRLIETGKTEKAQRIAAKTAHSYPECAAAQLLLQHCETWAQPAGLTPVASAMRTKALDQTDTQIVAQMLIVDVPDSFFERLGLEFETILPEPQGRQVERIGVDFDFNPPKYIGYGPPGVTDLEVEAIRKPNPSEPACLELVLCETAKAHAVLSPLETRFLQLAMNDGNCEVLSRPQIRTLPNQPAQVEISDDPQNVKVELVAEVSQDGTQVELEINGKSQGRTSQIQETVPVGKTLLMSLGSHSIESVFEQRVPVLSDIPYVSRLFKSKGIARRNRHRLVFITPKIVEEPKSYPVTKPYRN